MTGKLSKNFHGVGIGPRSKILAVKSEVKSITKFGRVLIDLGKSQDIVY